MPKKMQPPERLTDSQRQLVEANMPLVPYTYAKYIRENMPKNISHDDVISNGYMGLMRAAQLYNEDMDTKFSSYAVQAIMMNMIKTFQDMEYRHDVKLYTITDIKGMNSVRGHEGAENWVEDKLLGTKTDDYESMENRELFIEIRKRAQLLDSEDEIIELILAGYTGVEIAKRKNITHQRVYQCRKRAYDRMRETGRELYEAAFPAAKKPVKGKTIREKRKLKGV